MMNTEILHHIEALQMELANADPHGQTAAVALAVAEIAADLRAAPAQSSRTDLRISMPNG